MSMLIKNALSTSLQRTECPWSPAHLVIFGKGMTVLQGGPSSSSGSVWTGVGTRIDAANLYNNNDCVARVITL